MYYVPDGTEMCGYYECKDCGSRFLDVKIGPQIVCPYCGEEPDMEIGPDEEMPKVTESAKLIQVVRGAEEVEKINTASSCLDMRRLLSEECDVALKRRVEKWRSSAHSCGA